MTTAAQVIFADVGQGDCTILVDPDLRQAMVVDCPSKNVDQVHQYLTSNRLILHTLIVTHWDKDHYGGVARLAKAHRPSLVHYNHDTLLPEEGRGVRGIRSTLKEFLDLPWHSLKPADDQQSGQFGTIRWSVLSPCHAEITEAMSKGRRNVASCVVDIHAANTRILVGGDAVAATWARLMRSGLDTADFLRWPHHGAELHGDAGNSIAQAVLAQVRPAQVVISVGTSNSYDHPAQSVIKLARAASRVTCTERTVLCMSISRRAAHVLCGGSMLVDIDGSGYRVSTLTL